jgi:predicted GIY-YIG superfamily endonuclease
MGSAKIRVDDLMVRGVYFLYQGKEIVYIGMSDKNIMERICAHTEDTEKGFDSFTFNSHGGTKKQIEHIEKLMIKKYNPKYNVRHKQKVKPPKIIYC